MKTTWKPGAFLILAGLVTPVYPGNRNPRVVSYSPASQAMISADNLEIMVQFDESIEPGSLDSRSFSVFGRWTGVCPGEFILENDNRTVRFVPEKILSAGEWITVSLARTIQNSAGENLDRGFAWNFWTAAGKGSLEMQRIDVISVRAPGEGRIRTYGAYAGDLNGDGYHDFTVPNEEASDIRVFLNNRQGGYADFEIYPLNPSSVPSTNEGADFNGDGLLDFAVGNIAAGTMSVLMGNGEGGFGQPANYRAGAGTRGLCILDLNMDGAPDIVTANRVASTITLFLNNGSGVFDEGIQMDAGIQGETACASADVNNDGLMDVFVGGFDSNEIAVLVGDANGRLRFESRISAGGNPWMIAAGDLNNDGNVDVASVNANFSQFAVLLGNGDGSLQPPRLVTTGQFPLAIDLGDLDGDGDLDLVTSSFASVDWRIFENIGQGRFLGPVVLSASIAASCAVLHDRDRDGDLDLTGIDELSDELFLFSNSGATYVPNNPASQIPLQFDLEQSYPNPAAKTGANRADAVIIPFSLNQALQVKLDVVNILGQRVATLIDSELSPGKHIASLPLSSLATGIYFYRLTSRTGVITKRIVIFP